MASFETLDNSEERTIMKNLLASWKTTSAGAVMIIGSVIHLIFAVRSGTATEGVWTASLTAIVAGLGLIFAGDAAASVAKSEADTTFVKKDNGGTTPPKPPGGG